METDAGIVFRVARTPGTAERYDRERRLLDLLRPRLPAAVPEPRWSVASAPGLPLGASGYRKIEGRLLSPELLRPDNRDAIAAQIATVLHALRSAPLDAVPPLEPATPAAMRAHYRSLRADTSPALRERLRPAEYDRIERWWEDFLSDDRLLAYEPLLSHNDFWFGNMLVDERAERLAGIVDWEFCGPGDPAMDFATLLHLGPEFTSLVIEAFRAGGGPFGPEEDYRMRRLWQVREFYGVLYGVRFEDEAELADAVRKLRAGPILTRPEAPC